MIGAIAVAMIDLVSWLLGLVGHRRSVLLGRALGLFVFHVVRVRRRVVEANLAHAFPEKSPEERRRIAIGCYRQLGRVVMETLLMPRLSPDEMAGMVRFQGEEKLRASAGSAGGAIVCIGHLGNWELFGFEAGRRGYKFHAITKVLKGSFNERLHRTRKKAFGELPPKGSFGAALEVLARGEILALIVDQHSPSDRALVVEFLGRPAATSPSPALFALRSGKPVFTAWMTLAEDDRYEIRVEGPFPLPETGTIEERLQAHTQLVAAELERVIRQRPEQWFWVHRRWKWADAKARASAAQGGVMNRLIGVLALGVVAGFALVMAFGPGLLGWWSRPMVPTLVACDGAIEAATRLLVQAQLVAAAVFALVFVVVDFVWIRKRPAPVGLASGQGPAAVDPDARRES